MTGSSIGNIKQAEAERIRRDIEAFLRAGNSITVVPTGVSGTDGRSIRRRGVPHAKKKT